MLLSARFSFLPYFTICFVALLPILFIFLWAGVRVDMPMPNYLSTYFTVC
jgi:hypothetical protein